MNSTTITPRETDQQLAEVWTEIYKINGRIDSNATDLLRYAGAKFYYRGRQRVTDMKLSEALEIVQAKADYAAEYKATHTTTEVSEWRGETHTYHGTDWSDFQGVPHEVDQIDRALAKRAEYTATLETLLAQRDALEDSYTGWSRFFLVTSSAGHIHSSMHCSTCRPTTTYGWLPELSDSTEAEAVAAHGQTLCSVCFPSAPVEWTTGKKITAAQAARKAA